MSSETVQKPKGPVMDPGICRCCRSIKKCRLITSEYEWMGSKEIYSEMLLDCFGLLLSYDEDNNRDSCICATCVQRLREAAAFRKQVLQCEETFLQFKIAGSKDVADLIEVEVKCEQMDSNLGSPASGDASVDAPESQPASPVDNVEEETKRAVKAASSARVTRRRARGPEPARGGGAEPAPGRKTRRNAGRVVNEHPKRRPAARESKKKPPPDRDHEAFTNTVTIVRNSYVCPFHNRVSNYYCYYCREQFTDPCELREHTLTHDTKDFESMTDNKRPPKIDITQIDCRLCAEKIDDLDTFRRHITGVHNLTLHNLTNEFLTFRLTLGNIACTECTATFPYFDLLKKHMTVHFGTHTCHTCGACFLEHSSLLTHLRTHLKSREANFPCEICGKNLKSKYSRYLHVATIHEKKPTVNCYKCDESFLSYALRTRHLIEVHNDRRTFPCKSCDKVYNRRKTLMEHNRRTHLKVYRHQCQLCDQKFYLPSRLKDHMVTHTGERNFRCDDCDKSYPRLKSLREHIRTHTNDRRFKCDACDSTFTQSCSLKSHQKTHQEFAFDAEFT